MPTKTTIEALRAEAKKRLAAQRPNLVVPHPPPRYDEVFYRGIDELFKA